MVVGRIMRVSGPLVVAENMKGSMVYEVVHVGEERLIGEIIGLQEDKAFIQVYEDTSGLRVGEPVEGTGNLLSAELGPGIVGKVFDGLQRPLSVLGGLIGPFIEKGVKVEALPRDIKWGFIKSSSIRPGDKVEPGTLLGSVKETQIMEHKIMVPPGIHGTLKELAPDGEYTIEDTIAVVDLGGGKLKELRMMHKWPVRKPRPYINRLEPVHPLITGTRVLDMMFPIARGGKAAVPGGFGSGKCLMPGTPVLLSDGSQKKIDEIFEEVKGEGHVHEIPEEIYELREPLSLIGFDGKRLKTVEATHIYRGFTSKVSRIKTALGRLIEVTPIHKLPVLGKDNAVHEIRAMDLMPGMPLIVPRDLDSAIGIPKGVITDEIESVELIDKDTMVYDLVVPETHNFVGGVDPVIFHNTVLLQTLTKWARTQLNIYVGCGERGNEMADALHSFLKLKDPKSGRPLAEKAVFIANTSNMPVAARETSVFLGVTIGEYFRDMGYDVLMVADSTSRWAEAMREISARLEEMPGEEGFPAYLGSRLAEFYERSGRVNCVGEPPREGSLTIVGAVSPPGADFSEPVTQNTLRYIGTLVALDISLANRRHFPAVSWLLSYSLYVESVEKWWKKQFPDWLSVRNEALKILQRENELMEIVRLVGPDALPDDDKLLLDAARMIREDFLQQNAFHPIDAYSPPEKTVMMLKVILEFYHNASKALSSGVPLQKIRQSPLRAKIARMKEIPANKFRESYESLMEETSTFFNNLVKGGKE